jgi:hypothetical protein
MPGKTVKTPADFADAIEAKHVQQLGMLPLK